MISYYTRLLVRRTLVQTFVWYCFYSWWYLSDVQVLVCNYCCIPVNINCCRESHWCRRQYKYTGGERCWYRNSIWVWWQTSHWWWIKSSTVCYCVSHWISVSHWIVHLLTEQFSMLRTGALCSVWKLCGFTKLWHVRCGSHTRFLDLECDLVLLLIVFFFFCLLGRPYSK